MRISRNVLIPSILISSIPWLKRLALKGVLHDQTRSCLQAGILDHFSYTEFQMGTGTLQGGVTSQREDYIVWKMRLTLNLRRWAKRQNGSISAASKYWRSVGERKWVFKPKNSSIQLASLCETFFFESN